MPATSPNTENPETGMPKVHFEAPVATQSDRRISQERVAQLRQQRALYRANQRMARMEYNLWMGREPLRPAWNDANDRTAMPPTIVLPVFINSLKSSLTRRGCNWLVYHHDFGLQNDDSALREPHSPNPPLSQSSTLPILHSPNPPLSQSSTLPILHSFPSCPPLRPSQTFPKGIRGLPLSLAAPLNPWSEQGCSKQVHDTGLHPIHRRLCCKISNRVTLPTSMRLHSSHDRPPIGSCAEFFGAVQ